MNMTYNEEVDVLTITLSQAAIVDSDEVKPGIILDYDEAGHTVSIEILDASRQVDNLYSVSYDYARMKSAERDTAEADAATLSAV